MLFIFYWFIAFCIAMPGLALLIIGLVFLSQRKREAATMLISIAVGLLLLAFAIVGWSIYEINTVCPANPPACG